MTTDSTAGTTEGVTSLAQLTKSRYGSDAARLGTNLGDLVCGEYDLAGLTHEAKTILIYDISQAQILAMRLGWHEHTGDWDWRVTVRYEVSDGHGGHEVREAGTWEGEEPDPDECGPWADTWGLVIPEGLCDMTELEEGATMPQRRDPERRAKGEPFTLCVDHEKFTEMFVEEYRDTTDDDHMVHIPIDSVLSISVWYDS